MNLDSRIESILFVAEDPVKISEIARVTGARKEEILDSAEKLQQTYNERTAGINVIIQDEKLQLVSNPDNSDVVENFTDQQVTSNLTDSQLEALSIIAYRSPITKPELEEIRGVNCTRILRNLKKRGLVNEEEKEERLVPVFKLSFEAMRHLGIESTKDLPDYNQLSSHKNIEKLLEDELHES
jgi:segregation and condensation protein B